MGKKYRTDQHLIRLALDLQRANAALARASATDRPTARLQRDRAQQAFNTYLRPQKATSVATRDPVRRIAGRDIVFGVDVGLTSDLMKPAKW
jgi:hypothetical protein